MGDVEGWSKKGKELVDMNNSVVTAGVGGPVWADGRGRQSKEDKW